MKRTSGFIVVICLFFLVSCKKSDAPAPAPTPVPSAFGVSASSIDGATGNGIIYDVSARPVIRISFGQPLNRNTVTGALSVMENSLNAVAFSIDYANGDSTLLITPTSNLTYLTRYSVSVSTQLTSKAGGNLSSAATISFITRVDPARKFPAVSDDELMNIIQKRTFAYFWDGAHPVSGLARERNTSNETVTSGGSGFGIMCIVTAVSRNFITRAEGLARMQKIVGFLKTKAQTFHGAFPHWLNGTSGAVIPFSANDNGADLVETSYLMQGLLTARQYFSSATTDETTLRADINALWEAVDWNFFTRGGQVLYWHWSPDKDWIMNVPIKGWNECMITYALAASSPTHPITKAVYDNGWASLGGMRNGNSYGGIVLPLGPPYGGPLFFAHYSFLGINPNGLTDAYADYATQNRNHATINYNYCVANPNHYYGYSDSCWGLTASDVPNGYAASSPTNDLGVIAPTAALSSFPYTPAQSLKAMRYFYYTLGDKIFKQYGFVDAFSLKDLWFADSFLAIDQGPIIIMMENYRTGLLWNLFMSCPEVKTGMKGLGFQSPNL